jgi:hypothetical protein
MVFARVDPQDYRACRARRGMPPDHCLLASPNHAQRQRRDLLVRTETNRRSKFPWQGLHLIMPVAAAACFAAPSFEPRGKVP